ncbi:cell division protein ZapE [Pelagibacteraceae bacterium]|nr:cell division protein ZapE [Pelagibacteraceae bacterium]
MQKKNIKISFLDYCKKNNLQINQNQIIILNLLINFYYTKKNSFLSFANLFLNKSKIKSSFYLYGNIGVGKTMILDFFYNLITEDKCRMHFNEFMIMFHEFCHDQKKNKKNPVEIFVKNLKKKYKILYLDEFQVTNIVDAMILGKLFEAIFKNNLKIIITSNIRINNLYKDGLQREQFIPFIELIKRNSIEEELIINDDYRKSGINKLDRFFYPLNENTSFKINRLFRHFSKNKKKNKKTINIKGRFFYIENFFEGIAKLNFNSLCNTNSGAEDYIKIAEQCNFIFIENLPNFSDNNQDKQNRFITLIDIFYEKKIPLAISSEKSIEKIGSSFALKNTFKRTKSRIFELTSSNFLQN